MGESPEPRAARRSDDQLKPYSSSLLRLARGMGLSTEDAEDCVQDCLLAYIEHAETVRCPAAWLRRVLIHRVLQHLGERKRERSRSIFHGAPAPAEATLDCRLDLARALGRLRPGARRILYGRYALGLSEEEAGRSVGLASSSAKQSLRRARAALRRAIEGRRN